MILMANEFTVLLAQKEGQSARGLEAGGVSLHGQPFHRTGNMGLVESLEAVAEAGLLLAPTYALVAGRAFAGKDSPAWQEYHDSRAERLTLLDANGVMGNKGDDYAADVQNGGLFVHDPSRIRAAVTDGTLVNRALKLEQKEVDAFLDAYKRNDTAGLNQMLRGERFAFSGNYAAFLDASQAQGFLAGMDATYVVLRPVAEARALKSDYQSTESQKDNPDIIIASGGKAAAEKMLDKAVGFEWTQFGSWHDGYKNANTGRVVDLLSRNYGVHGNWDLGFNGYCVGVAPEARAAFFSGKVIDPLALKVEEAMRGSPVDHADGVPLVQRKQ